MILIAALTGKSEEAAKSMYYHAIKSLKESFEKKYKSCDTFVPKVSLTNRG
jgi:hypothetical protein